MYLNVSQLMQERSGSSRAFEIDEQMGPGEDAGPRHIRGSVKLLRTDQGIWVSATLDSDAMCTCSRCLVEYNQLIHMTIDEEFLPPDSDAQYEGSLLDGAGDSARIEGNNILDLAEAVRQYIDLSVPMKPTCRSDCRGMCPACGVDLNKYSHQCESSARDSRWGPLLDMVASK